MFSLFRRLALIVTGALILAIPPASAQPLLQWTFDEASSGDSDALDSGAAPAESGIFLGGATRTSDTPNGHSTAAADLLAVGDGHILADNSSALENLSQLTITAWINLQADPSSDGSGNDRVVALQGDNPWPGFTLNLNAPNEGEYSADDFRLALFIGGENGFEWAPSTADVDGHAGEWVFLSTTYDGLGFFDNLVYYSGDETTPTAQLGDPATLTAGAIASTGVNFYAGKTDAATDSNTSLEGYIDDIRIYDTILSLEALEAVRMENLGSVGPSADFNEDGAVDGDDFLLWQGGFGIESGATHMQGDANADGAVDGDDFLLWQSQFEGAAGSGATDAVPEPTAAILSLMLLAILPMIWTRRR